jgi:hypothetical protein
MRRHINLYDPALERKHDWLALHYVAGGAAVLAFAMAAWGYVARMDLPALAAGTASAETQLKAAREQLATLGKQLADRKPDPRLAEDIEAQRRMHALRGEVLSVLRAGLGADAASFADHLRGLARQTVSGMWLTGFSLSASGGVEIRGRTLDPALLPEYIRRLNREQVFQGRSFAAFNLDAGKIEASAGDAPKAPGGGETRPSWHDFVLVPVAAEAGAAAPAGKEAG